MTEKIVGYALLTIGFGIIVFALISAYLVFTKQMAPVDLFHFPGITVDISSAISAGLPKELTQTGFVLPPQKQEIISADIINVSMNYFTYLIFMGFMVTGGAKIAGVGAQLVRPVIVRVNEKTAPNKT
jgi:hypothetical protein